MHLIQTSYPIGRQNSAYFGYIHCKLPAHVVGDVKNALSLDEDVLRFLIISPPFEKGVREQVLRQETFTPKRDERKRTPVKPQPETALSNDLLEEKLEEILQKE